MKRKHLVVKCTITGGVRGERRETQFEYINNETSTALSVDPPHPLSLCLFLSLLFLLRLARGCSNALPLRVSPLLERIELEPRLSVVPRSSSCSKTT